MEFIHAKMTFIHMKSFIYVGGLKSHYVLSYKLKVPSLGFRLMHKPSFLFVGGSFLQSLNFRS